MLKGNSPKTYENEMKLTIYFVPEHIQRMNFGSLGKQDRPFIYIHWNKFTYRLTARSFVSKNCSFSHLGSSIKHW